MVLSLGALFVCVCGCVNNDLSGTRIMGHYWPDSLIEIRLPALQLSANWWRKWLEEIHIIARPWQPHQREQFSTQMRTGFPLALDFPLTQQPIFPWFSPHFRPAFPGFERLCVWHMSIAVAPPSARKAKMAPSMWKEASESEIISLSPIWMSDWVSDCVTDWLTAWLTGESASEWAVWLFDWCMVLLIDWCLCWSLIA